MKYESYASIVYSDVPLAMQVWSVLGSADPELPWFPIHFCRRSVTWRRIWKKYAIDDM